MSSRLLEEWPRFYETYWGKGMNCMCQSRVCTFCLSVLLCMAHNSADTQALLFLFFFCFFSRNFILGTFNCVWVWTKGQNVGIKRDWKTMLCSSSSWVSSLLFLSGFCRCFRDEPVNEWYLMPDHLNNRNNRKDWLYDLCCIEHRDIKIWKLKEVGCCWSQQQQATDR